MKVAIYFAEGYEELEALAVVDLLRRGEVDITMVGVTGKHVKSARGIDIYMDTTIDELNHDVIDMLILPGGIPGIYNLENNDKVIEHIKDFKDKKKWLAAICAAPSILGKYGLLVNERATCYPGNEKHLIGCEYIDEGTVVSHNIITSKGVGTAFEFALVLLEIIKGKTVADKVRANTLIK